INIALVTNPNSYIEKLFSLTSAALPINHPTLERIASYGAVNAVAIDMSVFSKDMLPQIDSAINDSTSILVFVNSQDLLSKARSIFDTKYPSVYYFSFNKQLSY